MTHTTNRQSRQLLPAGSTFVIAAILAAVSSVVNPVFADDLAAAKTALKSLVIELAKESALNNRCALGVPSDAAGNPTGLGTGQTIGPCQAADQPGVGLVCPPAGTVVSEPIECSYESDLKAKATFAPLVNAFIDYDSSEKLVAKILGTRFSIPDHVHSPNGARTPEPVRWPKARANFTYLFAFYQADEVNAQVPVGTNDPATLATFTALVQAGSEKHEAFTQGPINLCIYQAHDAPLPPRCDFGTPGGGEDGGGSGSGTSPGSGTGTGMGPGTGSGSGSGTGPGSGTGTGTELQPPPSPPGAGSPN